MGLELEGQYTIVEDLISQVTWDVGARESMPESIQADADSDYVILKKLMDPNEFMQMVRAEFEAMAEQEAGKEAG